MNSCKTPTIDDALLQELHALASASLSGEPTDEEIARLERLVCENEDFRKLYVRYMYVSWNLRAMAKFPPSESAAEPLSENAGAAPSELPTRLDSGASPAVPRLGFFNTAYHGTVGFFSQEIPFACLVTTFIMGVAGVIGLNITKEHYTQLPWRSVASADRSYSAQDSDGADKTNAAVKKEKMGWIGRVTGMVDCVWAAPGRTFGSSTDYLVALHDKYSLSSGLMEITYSTGAKVILQGPCTYEVDSASGGYLSLGKLTARVEGKGSGDAGRGTGEETVASGQWSVASEAGEREEGRGESAKPQENPPSALRLPPSSSPQPLAPSPSALFAVRTPTAVVTDLGTEFGVEINKAGETLSHVFQGSVTVRYINAEGVAVGREVTLDEGQSAQVAADADPKEPIVLVALDNTENPEKVAAAGFVRKLPVADPRAYAKAVLADKPVFYWTFDEPWGLAFEQVRRLSHAALIPEYSAGRCSHAAIKSGLHLGRAADFSQGAGCFRAMDMRQGEMPGAWAIEFWMQATGDLTGHAERYILNVENPNRVGWNCPAIIFDWPKLADDNELQLFYVNRTDDNRTRGGPCIADRAWRHVMSVFHGDEKRNAGPDDKPALVTFVIDGRPQTATYDGTRLPFCLQNQLVLGAALPSGKQPFCGRVDELAIYDWSEVPATEIAARAADMAKRHINEAKGKDEGLGIRD